ncbi:MAG: DMT family transporter [Armatimonadota bacterium]|nr:DMT family transporter [Armatimonadota bacterium]MDR5697594.1 DMT family transporter [Armatimonadota bacterium]
MRFRDWVVLVALGLIWGTSYLFIKIAVREFAPATLVALRLGLAAVVLLPVVYLRGGRLPSDPHTWGRLVLLGTINAAVPITLISWAELHITSAAASILNATTPLWSVILTQLVGEEPLTWPRVIGVTLGFVGVVVLLGGDLGAVARADLVGSLAVVIASGLYAAGILYARRKLRHLDVAVLAVGSLVGATVFLIPFAVASGLPARVSPAPLASLLALSLGGTAIAYLLYFHLVKNVGVTQVTLVTYINPATAVLWGWLVLAEPVTGQVAGGLGLILLGIAIVNSVHERLRMGHRKPPDMRTYDRVKSS